MKKVIAEKDVKKSYTKHPKYYLVDRRDNLQILKEYRNSKTIIQKM